MGEIIRLKNDEEAFVIEPILEIMSMEDEANQTFEDKLRNQTTHIFHSRVSQAKSHDEVNQVNSLHGKRQDSLHIEIVDMKEQNNGKGEEPLCDIEFT